MRHKRLPYTEVVNVECQCRGIKSQPLGTSPIISVIVSRLVKTEGLELIFRYLFKLNI